MDSPATEKRKRRRKTLACEECRRRKIRCNRQKPCNNCISAFRWELCCFQPDPRTGPQVQSPMQLAPPAQQLEQQLQLPTLFWGGNPAEQGNVSDSHVSGSLVKQEGLGGVAPAQVLGPAPSSGPAPARVPGQQAGLARPGGHGHEPTVAATASDLQVSQLQEEIRRLQTQLAQARRSNEPRQRLYQQKASNSPATASSTTTSTQSARHDLPSFSATLTQNQPLPGYRIIHMLKDGSNVQGEPVPEGSADDKFPGRTRYIGQGHWMNGALMAMMKPWLQEVLGKHETANELIRENGKTCKALARVIKQRRTPPSIPARIGDHVPNRALADSLIDGYLRTFESVFRIMHIPSFKRNYRRYWDNPAQTNPGFIIHMQLCMALGIFLHDNIVDLRWLATQWIHEGQIWLMAPTISEKARMTIPNLQTMCLLHLARETSGVGGDLGWVNAGSILRSAMYMGLHRDPAHIPGVPPCLAEIRRRLWAVVLELSLQGCLDSGGPPLLSVDDFDTQPPGNFFDDQLFQFDNPLNVQSVKPPTVFTDTSVQIALTKSFSTRLAVAHFINDFRNQAAYDDVLHLNAELHTACQTLDTTLQSLRSVGRGSSQAGYIRPSTFQLRFVEHLTQRFFLSLNQAYLAVSQMDTKYYFSRRISVDTALKLHWAWSSKPLGPQAPLGPGERTFGSATTAASVLSGASTENISSISTASSPWATAGSSSSVSSGFTLGDSFHSVLNSNGHGPVFQPAVPHASDDDIESDDFNRLCTVAAGGLRTVSIQCMATLSMELLWQLEGEHALQLNLGYANSSEAAASCSEESEDPMGGTDSLAASILAMPGIVTKAILVEAIERSVEFGEQRLLAGETNHKGYIYAGAVLAQARALQCGANEEEMKRAVLADGEARLKHCVELMRAVAERPQNGEFRAVQTKTAAQPAAAQPAQAPTQNASTTAEMPHLTSLVSHVYLSAPTSQPELSAQAPPNLAALSEGMLQAGQLGPPVMPGLPGQLIVPNTYSPDDGDLNIELLINPMPPMAPLNAEIVNGWLSSEMQNFQSTYTMQSEYQAFDWNRMMLDGAFNYDLNMQFADPFSGI